VPKPKTMDLIDACRSPLRRQIMQTAEEAAHLGKTVSADGIAKALKRNLGSTSYHVKLLAAAGALELADTRQVRGALQKLYVPSEAFRAEMTDTIALDLIAELIDGKSFTDIIRKDLIKLIRATGRPVEA